MERTLDDLLIEETGVGEILGRVLYLILPLWTISTLSVSIVGRNWGSWYYLLIWRVSSQRVHWLIQWHDQTPNTLLKHCLLSLFQSQTVYVWLNVSLLASLQGRKRTWRCHPFVRYGHLSHNHPAPRSDHFFFQINFQNRGHMVF